MTMTTQAQVRAAFWCDHENVPGITRRKIKNYSGNGDISQALAERVTQ